MQLLYNEQLDDIKWQIQSRGRGRGETEREGREKTLVLYFQVVEDNVSVSKT